MIERVETKVVRAVGMGRLAKSPRKHWELRRFVAAALWKRMVQVYTATWLPEELRWKARRLSVMLRPIAGGSSASNATEDDILALIFTATAIANIADNASTSPATTISTALHTGDPGETGTQATSEAAYTNYARQTPARSGSGFTVSSGAVTPDADITFPESGAAGSTITHFSFGSGVSDDMMFYGPVTPNIPVGDEGVTPVLDQTTSVSLN